LVFGRLGGVVLPGIGVDAVELVSYSHPYHSPFIHAVRRVDSGILRTYSLPIYLEHRQNLHLLKSLPPNTLDWSMLCPGTMTPESTDINVPTAKSSHGNLIANAATPPSWQDSWIKYIPLIGTTLLCVWNALRYETTLEQNADFIANDLESYESRWSGTTVGVIDGSR